MTHLGFTLIGALAGIPAMLVSRRLIEDRRFTMPSSVLFTSRYSELIWIAASALGYLAISLALSGSSSATLAYTAAIFELLLVISAVDATIRLIPNELLASLIMVFLAGKYLNGGLSGLGSNLLGAAAASVVFLIPSKLKLNIGWGDVKYAFVIGLCTGLLNFVEVMLVMAVGVALYALYLNATKKGTLKTSAPMGPYLSLGVMTAMLFPAF